jgi:hypothetical protein
MTSLEKLNEIAASATDFRLESYNGEQLQIIGSFDLCYYHDVELIFSGVAFIRCAAEFTYPQFTDAGFVPGGFRTLIHAEEGEFEIVARSLVVTFGKVFHYDRGDQLKPGERIADWVKRKSASSETGTRDV